MRGKLRPRGPRGAPKAKNWDDILHTILETALQLGSACNRGIPIRFGGLGHCLFK